MDNKKWIAAAIIAVSVGVVIVSIITAPSKRARKSETVSQSRSSFTSGPLLDTDIKKELESMPDDPAALAKLGDEYFEKNMFGQAIEIYEKTLQLNPKDVDTFNDLGLAYFYAGKPDNALETLRKGTEAVPTYQRIWLSYGYVLASLDRKEEAKLAFNKAVELAPGSIVGQEAKRLIGTLN